MIFFFLPYPSSFEVACTEAVCIHSFRPIKKKCAKKHPRAAELTASAQNAFTHTNTPKHNEWQTRSANGREPGRKLAPALKGRANESRPMARASWSGWLATSRARTGTCRRSRSERPFFETRRWCTEGATWTRSPYECSPTWLSITTTNKQHTTTTKLLSSFCGPFVLQPNQTAVLGRFTIPSKEDDLWKDEEEEEDDLILVATFAASLGADPPDPESCLFTFVTSAAVVVENNSFPSFFQS